MPPELNLAVEAVKERMERTGNRLITFKWLADQFKARGLTQHHLKELAGLGLLIRREATRNGHRAYYDVPDLPLWSQPAA